MDTGLRLLKLLFPQQLKQYYMQIISNNHNFNSGPNIGAGHGSCMIFSNLLDMLTQMIMKYE